MFCYQTTPHPSFQLSQLKTDALVQGDIQLKVLCFWTSWDAAYCPCINKDDQTVITGFADTCLSIKNSITLPLGTKNLATLLFAAEQTIKQNARNRYWRLLFQLYCSNIYIIEWFSTMSATGPLLDLQKWWGTPRTVLMIRVILSNNLHFCSSRPHLILPFACLAFLHSWCVVQNTDIKTRAMPGS